MSANPLAPAWLAIPADANAIAPTVWSSGATRAGSGELTIAGLPASEIAAEYGTPVYVVDEADARGRARSIRESFDREFAAIGSSAKVYYAGKAFLTIEVARWMIADGLNIDVCSGGELAVVLAAGVDPSRLGLHGNNKSLLEIDRAVEVGVGAIVLDSFVEIERVAEAAARRGRVQPVRLRINSGVHASTHEYLATAREDQKFGIPLADAEGAVAIIRSHESLRFLGLHSHIGSQIFESEGFVEAAHRLFEVHARLLEGGQVPELNLGGGFGIAYTSADVAIPLHEIARRFAEIVAAAASARGVPVPVVAVEPGRAIIGPAGTTIYEVGTVKPVEVSLDGGGSTAAVRTYVSIDGGMSDNIRPALYAAEYSAALASRSSAAEPVVSRVVGLHCEGGDILVRDEFLPGDVAIGDLIAVPAAGAYSRSMASNYNHTPRPPVVSVRDGKVRTMLRRETLDDLLALDAGLSENEEPNG